jgi:hypothetical protein
MTWKQWVNWYRGKVSQATKDVARAQSLVATAEWELAKRLAAAKVAEERLATFTAELDALEH